jgi:ABC-type sugar transport system substrate-binding protein
MNRKTLLLAALLLAALFMVACGGQPAPEPVEESTEEAAPEEATEEAAAESGDQIVVGLVQIDLSHPFHLGEVEGAKEAARRHGFELRVTSGEGDVNKQIQAFENLVNEGVDAIAVNFIDVDAFGPAMQKAQDAGIPVVCLHSETEGCATVLGFDEWFTGRSVGDYSVELLQQNECWPDCQAANLQGLLGQGLNEARSGGWREQVEAAGVEVVASEPTDWQPEKAVAAMENWLVAYPDLNLVYGNSDGLTVPAAESAVAAGRDDIIFVSVDGSDFALEAIQNGLMASTFLYAPEYSGYWKAWVPFRAAMGEDLPGEILIKGVLVTEENVDQILELAQDQKEDMENFDFEKTLPELIDEYTGGGAAEEEPMAEGDQIVVGLVQIDLSHPFHLGEVEGAKEAARRNGFELRVTSGEGDVNKQIQAFENLVNEGVDAIAVNFIDVDAFGPAMQKAQEAGIPVICLHSETEGCATVLGFDEWYTGGQVGEYSVSLLEGNECWPDCQAANLQGLLGQGLNEARSGGWSQVLEDAGVEIVASEPTDWQPEKAVAAMENWLVAYPDLNLVYGNSDGLTVPAAETARAAGRDDIIFVSVDGSDFALEAIQDGLLASTFLYAPEYSGYWKAWVPFRAAMGEELPAEILIKGVLVNEENVDQILELAQDQKEDMENFQFELSLPELIDMYMGN